MVVLIAHLELFHFWLDPLFLLLVIIFMWPMCSSLLQELYHELHALDRFEQDYCRKLEEVDSLHLPRKGWPSTCSSFYRSFI